MRLDELLKIIDGEEATYVAQQGHNRRGVPVSRALYESMATFMVRLLEARGELQLGELLQQVNAHFATQQKADIAWLMLVVKNDLETRKVIKVIRGVGAERTQWVRLRKSSSIL